MTQAVALESVGLNQRLQTALSENEQHAQELRLLRSQREEMEHELEKHRRLVSHEAMDKDSATMELSALKAKVHELHSVVDQQTSALQAKQEELSLQRERLLKIQAEAEINERRVRELDTKLRMSEDANQVLQASARRNTSSLEHNSSEKDELRAALRRTEEQLDKMHSQVSMSPVVAFSFPSLPRRPPPSPPPCVLSYAVASPGSCVCILLLARPFFGPLVVRALPFYAPMCNSLPRIRIFWAACLSSKRNGLVRSISK